MALYQPPDGFSKAIECGEEYTKDSNPPNGSLWLNLAAANGQKYEYMKEHPGKLAGDSLEEVRNKAREAVKQAISVAPSTKGRLRELSENGDNEDDDLRVLVEDHPALRALLR
jgi:hypothetical protein